MLQIQWRSTKIWLGGKTCMSVRDRRVASSTPHGGGGSERTPREEAQSWQTDFSASDYTPLVSLPY